MTPEFPIKYPKKWKPEIKEKESYNWAEIALIVLAVCAILNVVLQTGVSMYIVGKSNNAEIKTHQNN